MAYWICVQGVSDKRYFSDFRLISVLEVGFYFFHMCFGIRILSPFHLQSCIMSQIWQIYLCKNIKRLG